MLLGMNFHKDIPKSAPERALGQCISISDCSVSTKRPLNELEFKFKGVNGHPSPKFESIIYIHKKKVLGNCNSLPILLANFDPCFLVS